MKQNITEEQYNELSHEQKEKLFKALFPEVYGEPKRDGTLWKVYNINNKYLTIGRMIEFLDDYSNRSWKIDTIHHDDPVNCKDHLGAFEYSLKWDDDKGRTGYISEGKDLCDVLWGAVKEVLNEQA